MSLEQRKKYNINNTPTVKRTVKVLYITDTMKQRAGITSVIMNFLSHWQDSNVSIDIIAYEDSEKEIVEKVEGLGAKVFFMPYLSPKNIQGFIKYYHSFFSEKHYDIVHSHFSQIDAIVFPIARKHGVRKCISHSHNTKLSDYKLKAIRNRIMCFNIAYNADYLAACSEKAGQVLYGRSFSRRKNKLIIRNGIDCEKFRFSVENRKQIRNEFGIADDAILIGHVGGFRPQKNHIFLVRVFSELIKENPNYKLMLVGYGETMEMVKEECHKLGIDNNVIFTGARSDVASLMSAMDMFLFPSHYEGLGVVLIEAQASGLFCVASDCVPNDAKVTNNTLWLPLNKGEQYWAERILEVPSITDSQRIEAVNEVYNNGYDITVEAKRLGDYYMAIVD